VENEKYLVAWNLFVELRKEIVESQKIRAQIIGFKITFVGAGIALIVSNLDKIPSILLVIPAFAAIFFDLLITSYSFSVKRIGNYCYNHLERLIRNSCELPEDFLLWQQFMSGPKLRQNLSLIGNIGLTMLALVPACIGLVQPYYGFYSLLLGAVLIALFVYDIKVFFLPKELRENYYTRDKSGQNI
jgi:hypothetical protein